MAVRLTEEMVIARSKSSDLQNIKKLNCWGSELGDVSIIKKMKGVEVLALSVNKIKSLSDFEDCLQLQELYLRKNNIQDINDLVYLQSLPKLKYLWLEENPCVESAGPGYRQMVLRALPNLQKLDNVDVTPEEVLEAQKSPPAQPAKKEEVYEDQFNDNYVYQQTPTNFRAHSPVREQVQHSPEITESECTSEPIERASVPSSPQRSPANADNYSPSEPNHNTSPRFQNQQRPYSQYNERSPEESPMTTSYREHRPPMQNSMSTHSMKEYYQGDYQRQPPPQYRHSQSDLTEWDENQHNGNTNGHQTNGHSNGPNQRRSMISNGGSTERYAGERPGEVYQYRNGNVSREDFGEDVDRRRGEVRRAEGRFNDSNSVISNAVLNHLAGIHRRPINRSSNLLSATLCLVKELDYSSLEVVEHAVRCRLDELAETL